MLHTLPVPSFSDPPVAWFQRAEQGLADRLAQRQRLSLTARSEASGRPGIASRLLIWIAVAPVHAVLIASSTLGVLLLVDGPTMPLRILGCVLLLVAYATSPRPSKLPRHSVSLAPADAPALFALVAEVAALGRSRTPARVLVTRDFNAFAARVGWRRTPVVGLGAPLWAAAPPQARVALLGHELGHFAHGDLTDGWWVWAAESSLVHWLDICGGPRGGLYTDNWFILRYALVPVRVVLLAYLWLIRQLNGPASQRREYLADIDAARAAGTPAAVRMLEVLLLEPSVSTAMTRAAVSPERPDMWELVSRDASNVGEAGFGRRRLAAGADRSRIDASHPTTLLRLELLESIPPSSAAVVLDSQRQQEIDAELARPLVLAAKHAGDHIRYRR